MTANSTFPHGSLWKSAGLARAGGDWWPLTVCAASRSTRELPRFKIHRSPAVFRPAKSKPSAGCGLIEIVRCRLKLKNSKAAVLLALSFSAGPLLACGPWFPNNMLDRGDEAVLVAPVADFEQELNRMQLPTARFREVFPDASYAVQTVETELTDLRAALKKTGKSDGEIETIIKQHQAEREK